MSLARNTTMVVAALALVLAACGNSGDTIDGMVIVTDFDGGMGPWDDCEGNGGYSDLGPGMSVSIADQDGRRIGASSLRNITMAGLQELGEDLLEAWGGDSAEEARKHLEEVEGFMCVFVFRADSVEDAEIYVVKVGVRRGEQSYTREHMEASNWFMSLSIGDL